MQHRHLEYPPDTPVTELGAAAIDDVLDRGTLRDWVPLMRALREDPWGQLSETVLRILDAHPMYGTGRLFRDLISRFRLESAPGWPHEASLVELRRLVGSTQSDVGAVLGMNQSEVSKLERREDVRLSSLAAYVAATGGRLRLVVDYPDVPSVELTHLLVHPASRARTPHPESQRSAGAKMPSARVAARSRAMIGSVPEWQYGAKHDTPGTTGRAG